MHCNFDDLHAMTNCTGKKEFCPVCAVARSQAANLTKGARERPVAPNMVVSIDY